MQSFFSLIDEMNAAPPAERARVEEAIWKTYGVEKAILALDMSHFSLSVRRSGILPYLGLIRRMHRITEPIVRECRGDVVKYVADNLLAVFAEVTDAVAAAVKINQALIEAPVFTATESLSVAIGIDHGRFVLVPGRDCYGDPVNIAYKLGEDLARPGEILITAAARERLDTAFAYPLLEQQVSAAGLTFKAYRVEYP